LVGRTCGSSPKSAIGLAEMDGRFILRAGAARSLARRHGAFTLFDQGADAPRSPMRGAFTLLELLLVLALLGMMLAISWPSLNRSLDTQRLKRGADLVRTHLLRARTKAMISGEIFSFRFQTDTGHFRVEQQSNLSGTLDSASMGQGGASGGGMTGGGGSAGASTAPSAGAQSGAATTIAAPPIDEELPEGVRFQSADVGTDPRSGSIATNNQSSSISDAAWSRPILFFPDGTATRATIVVLGQRERSIVVELRSLTGGVKVGEIGAGQGTRR
ncbi:MAG TPA: prepilin-type N-terminal cleavage/methylation domain-containing protein, partial [Pirellulales bacterium]|nr:prepilin-type N-terminal cleavage/methylation domain-containing protein [Pirellulales bacterium]